MREAVFAFQPQQQELPEGLEDDDEDDDDDSDSDADDEPAAGATGRVVLRILKGSLGYGMDIADDGQVTGFQAMDTNPAKAAGVPLPCKIVSVNGVEVRSFLAVACTLSPRCESRVSRNRPSRLIPHWRVIGAIQAGRDFSAAHCPSRSTCRVRLFGRGDDEGCGYGGVWEYRCWCLQRSREGCIVAGTALLARICAEPSRASCSLRFLSLLLGLVLQREGEACLVTALTNFKAAVALGGASDELQIIVQQLGVVLDGAIDLSKGGAFGF